MGPTSSAWGLNQVPDCSHDALRMGQAEGEAAETWGQPSRPVDNTQLVHNKALIVWDPDSRGVMAAQAAG